MMKLTDNEIGQAMDLATDLLTKASRGRYGSDRVALGIMTYEMCSELGYPNMTAGDMKQVIRTCGRILQEMPMIDEPRFSMHDYADAILNARSQVSMEKLLGLPDDEFAAAMVWLAADKRETYEGRGHLQEPLEVDVYMEAGA